MSSSAYQISVHRNFSTVFAKLDDFERSGDSVVSMIHVGTDRPGTDEIDLLFSDLKKALLATEPALLLLPSPYATQAVPLGSIPTSGSRSGLNVYCLTPESGAGPGSRISESISVTTDFHTGVEFVLKLLRTDDEEEYLFKRKSVAAELQDELDKLRISCLRPSFSNDSSEADSIFHFLQGFETELLETNVDRLPVNVRTYNALFQHGVTQIGDLLKLDLETVLKWKNFGRKSLQNLLDCIITFRREWSPDLRPDSQMAANEFRFIASVCEELEREGDRSMFVIQRRMGWLGRSETLEEIGRDLGVTRERVRQIEKKGLEKLRNQITWTGRMIKELDRLLTSRKEPLFIDLLELESSMFEGASHHARFVGNIITTLSKGKYSVWEIEGRTIMSRIDKAKWLEFNNNLRKSLEEKVNTSFTTDDLSLLAESLLSQDGALELKNRLVEGVSKLANFAPDRDGGNVLVSFGKAVPAWVEVVLHQAESPLHYSQIWERCQELAGRSMDIRRVHGALGSSDAWYFGRGIYGLAHHSHLTLDERDDLVRESENILLQNEPRQWHVGEILSELMNTRPDLSEGTDKFILNNVLRASSLLKYLGRSIWVTVDNERKRIDISDALESLLDEAGRPMPFAELESTLRRSRGLGGFALCTPTARLARVSPGTWGLIDRDFVINGQERSSLLNDLQKILDTREKGLHYTQLRSELHAVGNLIPAELTDYMIASIAQGDARFRVYRDRVLGLSAWGRSRCLSIDEGLSEVLEAIDLPASLDELRSSVENAIGRSVSSQAVYSLLPQHGIVYDETERGWIANGHTGEDGDEEDFSIAESL
jgi:hypothetical protein